MTRNEVPNPRCCSVPGHLCPTCRDALSGSARRRSSNITLNTDERRGYLPLPSLNAFEGLVGDEEHRRNMAIESTFADAEESLRQDNRRRLGLELPRTDDDVIGEAVTANNRRRNSNVSLTAAERSDVLLPPTINWAEEAAAEQREKDRQRRPVNDRRVAVSGRDTGVPGLSMPVI